MNPKKFIAFIRLNFGTIIAAIVIMTVVSVVLTFLYFGASNFTSLESFSRKQLMAQMGMYLFIGLMQAFVMVPLYLIGYYYIFMGGGFARGLSRDVATKTKTEVKWDDVIGMEDAKRDAWEIVQFIKDQNKVTSIGGTMIKGVMMIGPPGCGKTYLAKAMASEAGLPFLSAVGSEFVGIIVGLGAAKIKSLFKHARKLAEMEGGCIIFIDEIDSFARPRGEDKGFGGVMSQNATVNQFLTELDGVRKRENSIVVLAATNVPVEQLDDAIMRSGRFDRKIFIEKPTAREREKLLSFYLKKVKADPTINIEYLAEKAQWFSPSDINNMVREASIMAMRKSKPMVTVEELEAAMKEMMVTIEKIGGDKILSSRVNVKWDEVIGMENAKKEAWEVVELLKDRNKLKAVGGKIVKGVIMLGPPGCGKTYLAKAMATEAGFPFISKTGSDFVRMWVGEGARMVEETFKEARRLARAEGGCIIFIDEIDAFAFPREMDRGFGGTASMNAAINQFLTEMDGLRNTENNIVVLAATNAPERNLDPAMMRPGRFDRKIYITLPNLKERKALFEYYLARVKADSSCDPELLARKTLYFSPSKIDSMIREAGIFALREKRDVITFKDLSNAYDRIEYGDKSNIIMTENEKMWTAYHEAGHAIIGYLLHPTDDIIKATIIPRKGYLGMVDPRPVEELHSFDKDKLLADIKLDVAAYVAEKIKFGTTSTGVGGGPGSDFYTAMRIARYMVVNLGMGKSGLVGDFDALQSYYGEMRISEKTKEIIDQDIQNILRECMTEVEQILREKNDLFEYFSQELLQKGELEYDDIETIFKKFNLKPLKRVPRKTSA